MPLPRPTNAPSVAIWIYENIFSHIDRTFGMPLSFNRIKLEIKPKYSASPSDLGLDSGDKRQFGIGLKSLVFRE